MEHALDRAGRVRGSGHRGCSQRGACAYRILKGVLLGGQHHSPAVPRSLGGLALHAVPVWEEGEVWSQLLGCLTQSPHASPEPSIRGQFSTHSLTLFSWVARDSLGSSGARGSLSNKTGLQP